MEPAAGLGNPVSDPGRRGGLLPLAVAARIAFPAGNWLQLHCYRLQSSP